MRRFPFPAQANIATLPNYDAPRPVRYLYQIALSIKLANPFSIHMTGLKTIKKNRSGTETAITVRTDRCMANDFRSQFAKYNM